MCHSKLVMEGGLVFEATCGVGIFFSNHFQNYMPAGDYSPMSPTITRWRSVLGFEI